MLKVVSAALCLLPCLLYAAEEAPPVKDDAAQLDQAAPTREIATPVKRAWGGEGELGYTATSGNTDAESLNAKLGISSEKDKWKHTASIESLRSTTDNVTSAESLVFKERSEYSFTEKSYVFGKLRYEDDKFSGYDYQASVSLGVGSRFIKTERQLLDASIGAGYRALKDSATGETREGGIALADLVYEYSFSPTAKFTQSLSVESGEDNTRSESETGLKNKINGNLASKISYLVKHNSDVPLGTEKTDKVLTVSLVYSF